MNTLPYTNLKYRKCEVYNKYKKQYEVIFYIVPDESIRDISIDDIDSAKQIARELYFMGIEKNIQSL